FQAEDSIRDRNVTGVQTCALPIFSLRDAKLWNIVGTPYITVTRCFFIKFKIDLLEKAVGKQKDAPICKAWVAPKSDKEWFSGPRSEERRVGRECGGGREDVGQRAE